MADDDIITIKNEYGESVDFVKLAWIQYRDEFYAILRSVNGDEKISVYKVLYENGKNNYLLERDENVLDAVFLEYDKLINQSGNKKIKNEQNTFAETAHVATKTAGKGLKTIFLSVILIISAVFFVFNSVSAIVLLVSGGIGIALFSAVGGLISFLIMRRVFRKIKKTWKK